MHLATTTKKIEGKVTKTDVIRYAWNLGKRQGRGEEEKGGWEGVGVRDGRRERERERQTDRQTDRQTGRQAGRQAETKTDRQKVLTLDFK